MEGKQNVLYPLTQHLHIKAPHVLISLQCLKWASVVGLFDKQINGTLKSDVRYSRFFFGLKRWLQYEFASQ